MLWFVVIYCIFMFWVDVKYIIVLYGIIFLLVLLLMKYMLNVFVWIGEIFGCYNFIKVGFWFYFGNK